MDFEGYMNAYDTIFSKVGDKDVALTILTEMGKDRRTAAINGKENGAEKASAKQIEYLQDLGIEVKPGLSRAEASRLIDKAKQR